MNYYFEVLKKYAVFSGRAQRAEYWYFALFNVIINIVFGIVNAVVGGNIIIFIFSALFMLAILIPGIAVSVRRLHDTNHSGYWLFITLIPLIGLIIFIVFLISDSQVGENKYGPNPKEIKVG